MTDYFDVAVAGVRAFQRDHTMTQNERWLLTAAKEAQDYLARKLAGQLPKGMYEDITVTRTLTAAIAAVERDLESAKPGAAA